MVRLAFRYFAIVFGMAFVLGTLRTIFLVDAIGRRSAELIELPVLLGFILIVARSIGPRCSTPRQAMQVGWLALGMMLAAEIALAAVLMGKNPIQALSEKDPVSGTVYYLALILFALMPWLVHADRQQS